MPVLVHIVLLLAAWMLSAGEGSEGDRRTAAAYMTWNETHRLTWNDFRSRPASSSPLSALTASAIEYAFDCDGGRLELTVRAVFLPAESWVKANARTDYILAHEQLHFDITEIYARKLRRALQAQVHSCADTRKIDGIARQVLDEWKKAQHRYDRETGHSIHKPEQAAWQERIAAELRSYAPYRNAVWTVPD